jgi:N-acetylmuramic acid 6-phosphate etherase
MRSSTRQYRSFSERRRRRSGPRRVRASPERADPGEPGLDGLVASRQVRSQRSLERDGIDRPLEEPEQLLLPPTPLEKVPPQRVLVHVVPPAQAERGAGVRVEDDVGLDVALRVALDGEQLRDVERLREQRDGGTVRGAPGRSEERSGGEAEQLGQGNPRPVVEQDPARVRGGLGVVRPRRHLEGLAQPETARLALPRKRVEAPVLPDPEATPGPLDQVQRADPEDSLREAREDVLLPGPDRRRGGDVAVAPREVSDGLRVPDRGRPSRRVPRAPAREAPTEFTPASAGDQDSFPERGAEIVPVSVSFGPGGGYLEGGTWRSGGLNSAGARRPTERRNPRTGRLDTASSLEIVDLLGEEDRLVAGAVREARNEIAAVIDLVVEAFASGGRLIYVGAGTSGRLGVLDASECPPTFGSDPERVQGVIAGGDTALRRAVEGAEDDADAGAGAMDERGVRPGDVVVGLAASGSTPYVRGALDRARALGARVALVCCADPEPDAVRGRDVLVVARVGPEALAGSTRLKAGTATKMILNMVTTGAFARSGKTYGNLMVDLTAASEKLRDRAERIVAEAGGVDRGRARRALLRSGGRAKVALVMARLGVDVAEAERRLAEVGGRVRRLLGDPPEEGS